MTVQTLTGASRYGKVFSEDRNNAVDRERFAQLRDRLTGVSAAKRHEPTRLTEFEPIDPMLAETFDGDLAEFDDDGWYAERKYDGTRMLLEKFDGEVRLFTRRHVERSETVPELTSVARNTLPDGLVLDGEVTMVDDEGNSFFMPIHTDRDRLQEADDYFRIIFSDVCEEVCEGANFPADCRLCVVARRF